MMNTAGDPVPWQSMYSARPSPTSSRPANAGSRGSAAQTRDWDPWVEQYASDVIYVEHAAGTMHGREEVRAWIWKTMESFPGSYMTSFPSLWSVIDESTGRIICELDNPMRDPGDGM